MKVVGSSSGGFRSFDLPQEERFVNLTTLAKQLPSTHRLYPMVARMRGFDSEFGFTQGFGFIHGLSDQKLEEIMALANRAFRVTHRDLDEQRIVECIHSTVSEKIFQVLDALVSKVEQAIEYQKYIEQEYIDVGSELQQTLDCIDQLFPLTKKHPYTIRRQGYPDDNSADQIKSRMDAYSKKLPPPLIIRFFKAIADVFSSPAPRRTYSSYSGSSRSYSSTSSSNQRDRMWDRKAEMHRQNQRDRMWESKVEIHQRSQANYSLNLSRNLQSQRIQQNNTMRFHTHR